MKIVNVSVLTITVQIALIVPECEIYVVIYTE